MSTVIGWKRSDATDLAERASKLFTHLVKKGPRACDRCGSHSYAWVAVDSDGHDLYRDEVRAASIVCPRHYRSVREEAA